MNFTIATLTLESFLLVVVRIACFVAIAPVFGHRSINRRLRVLIAVCISLSVFSSANISLPEYETVIGYTLLILKEAVVGLLMGFVSSLVMSTLILAGEFIDREIGFTMSTNFDPSNGAMVTITAEMYDKMVYLIILLSNLRFYILKAIVQSFELVPLGHVSLSYPLLYTNILAFIGEYFVIGFRIAMPLFIGVTMLNVILGVLAKSSPQMNMFAVGMQLKVMTGLLILSVVIMFIPNITNYLMENMQEMVQTVLGGL